LHVRSICTRTHGRCWFLKSSPMLWTKSPSVGTS